MRLKPIFPIFLLSVSVLCCAQKPSRVQAVRDSMVVLQPDGTPLPIYLRGDERTHFRMTTDGYVVKKNKRGFYCYAKQNRKGNVVPSCRKAKNKRSRSNCDWMYLRKMEQNPLLYKEINNE